ncbi:Acyl-ACP thioesterase [Dillenia turbinata]|uniref:Acyl-[acyl-carrier-protein] hydrolase n=1 Tax=Dillenia turbinata TaxID=194707 RepID=A0AAN8Z6V4_9MAGN
MATTIGSARFLFQDSCKVENNVSSVYLLKKSNVGRPNLWVKAHNGSGSGSFGNVKVINGTKVNGVNVNVGGEASYLGIKRTELPLETACNINNNVVDDHAYMRGRFVEDRYVYRQTFIIRSYEIGPDKTATMETILNLLQETALNHVMSSGLAGGGFGATREMSLRKLIWVVTRIHIQVEEYSSWGDIVEIDTWVDAAGKNGMRRDWIIRDYSTQQIIARATSTWVIMNRETRKLCKIPEQVKAEVQPFYLNRNVLPAVQSDLEKIDKLTDDTAQRVRSGLADKPQIEQNQTLSLLAVSTGYYLALTIALFSIQPRWSDMDANLHVNNVKYIGWLLESVPIKVLEDYHLTSMTLEYRRECRQSNVLESLTTMRESTQEDSNVTNNSRAGLESTHLLRMQDDKAEIIRAKSEWKRKQKHAI